MDSQHASIRFTLPRHSSRDLLEVLRLTLGPPPPASPSRSTQSPAGPSREPGVLACRSSPHTSPHSPYRPSKTCPDLAHAHTTSRTLSAALCRCCAPDAARPNSTRSANLTPSPVPLSPLRRAAPSTTTAAPRGPQSRELPTATYHLYILDLRRASLSPFLPRCALVEPSFPTTTRSRLPQPGPRPHEHRHLPRRIADRALSPFYPYGPPVLVSSSCICSSSSARLDFALGTLERNPTSSFQARPKDQPTHSAPSSHLARADHALLSTVPIAYLDCWLPSSRSIPGYPATTPLHTKRAVPWLDTCQRSLIPTSSSPG